MQKNKAKKKKRWYKICVNEKNKEITNDDDDEEEDGIEGKQNKSVMKERNGK